MKIKYFSYATMGLLITGLLMAVGCSPSQFATSPLNTNNFQGPAITPQPSPSYNPSTTPTPVPPLPTPVPVITATFTSTAVPPTATRTSTPLPPTLIPTAVPPTAVPTATYTPTKTGTPLPYGQVITGTDANFSQILASATVPVVLEFWATWCPACTYYAPIITQFAKDYAGKVIVIRVNVDLNPTLLNTYGVFVSPGVYGVPQTAFFKNGSYDFTIMGADSESDLALELSSL